MRDCFYNYVIILAFLFFEQTASADPLHHEQTDWLKSMAFAAHQTNYSGTFVYQDGAGGHVEVSRITHIADAEGEHERLESLSGERREIVSSHNQVWMFVGERKVKIERRKTKRIFPALLPEQILMLKENYIIKEGEEDRVAGFHVHTLLFQPKDNLRYSHKMWADPETGLLLKAVVLDERLRIIEQHAFTELTLGDKVDRSWMASSQYRVVQFKNSASAQTPVELPMKASDWQIDALPLGFKLIQQSCHPMHEQTHIVTHLVFSDGLAGISVFIEELGGRENMATGLSSQGVIQIYTRIAGDKLITVVGEVPPRTVIQVAESVRYVGS